MLSNDRKSNREAVLQSWRETEPYCLGVPFVLFVELTRECNLRCPMCRNVSQGEHGKHMSEETIDRIETTLAPFAELVDLRGWGESLVRSDFTALVERIAKWGAQIRIVTNASVNQERKYEVLMRHGAWVYISIDAVEDGLLRRLRTTSTHVLKRGVSWFVKWREKYGMPRESVVAIAAVGRSNLHHIPELIRTVVDWGIQKFVLFPHICSPRDYESLLPFPEEVRQAVSRIATTAIDMDVECQLGAALHPHLALGQAVVQRCTHPWTHAYISFFGGLGFCDHLNGRDEFIVGSLMDSHPKDLWNSQPMMKLRRSIVHGVPCCRPCRWCHSNRYSDFEHLLPGFPQIGIVSTRMFGGKLCGRDFGTDESSGLFVRQTTELEVRQEDE